MKETNADSESNCFDFKKIQNENITFNENASRYEVGLPFKVYTRFLVIIILIVRNASIH